MFLKMSFCSETDCASIASEGPLEIMNVDMKPQLRGLRENFLANSAHRLAVLVSLKYFLSIGYCGALLGILAGSRVIVLRAVAGGTVRGPSTCTGPAGHRGCRGRGHRGGGHRGLVDALRCSDLHAVRRGGGRGGFPQRTVRLRDVRNVELRSKGRS